jgi:tetratricopeptide (TPR) repeat protein
MITALIDLMGIYYQSGNLNQMGVIARSILAAIPGDVVALQFLGLALYRMGDIEAARRVFSKLYTKADEAKSEVLVTTGELASATMLRLARSPASGLGDAWQSIAHALTKLGFKSAATQAYEASVAARGLVFLTGSETVTVSGKPGTGAR